MTTDILILNGPNLNLLGTRQPEIYGEHTLDEVIGSLRLQFPQLRIHHYQSNHEGALIDKLQEVGFSYAGIVMNPGAYAHTSIALADAVKSINTPVIEVHISDTNAREEFRKHSYLTEVVKQQIIGHGIEGYALAVKAFL